MKGEVRELVDRFRGNVGAVVAVILLLFPSSASVLCIAPGGHIAIEDINAPCCTPFGISTPAGCQPDNGFNAPSICHNCTDFFLTPNGRGALSESYDHAAASPLADECLDNHISAGTSLSLCRSDALTNIDAPIPVSSSVPLRC
jgi:hypothetical protein